MSDSVKVRGSIAPKSQAWPCLALALVSLLALSATVGLGADAVVFGPERYTRATGQPVAVTKTFQVANATRTFALRLTNHGVTSAVISVNERSVLAPDDFKGSNTANATLTRAVTLVTGQNTLVVELRGQPGTWLSIEIVATNVDVTPPVITTAITPAPNANGWNRTNVTVSFTCADTGSGVASCPAPVTVSAEGANHTVRGTATDKAGNSAAAAVTVNIDKTPPVVEAARVPAAGATGWNNEMVVVSFAAADALSGVVPSSVTSPVTLSSDGANQSATGHATDRAGNVGSATLTSIKIDRTRPTITVALTPAPNAAGIYTSAVTAHFTCADGGSGIATCPSDQIVTTPGVNQTVSGTTTDRAGNTATVTSNRFTIQPVVNRPPVVSAGPDQTITLPAGATLNGSVTDDGLPKSSRDESGRRGDRDDRDRDRDGRDRDGYDRDGYDRGGRDRDGRDRDGRDREGRDRDGYDRDGYDRDGCDRNGYDRNGRHHGHEHDRDNDGSATLTSMWSQVSGPGTARLARPSSPVTTVTFDRPGTYVLRLTASDSALSASSDVTITVKPAVTNQPPVVTAGPDQTVTLPAAAALNGSVTDDGLPAGSVLTSTWTKVSGPGTVTFADAAKPATTATFDQAGTYVLRLAGNDSVLTASAEVTISVKPTVTNQPPVVSAGSDQTIVLPAAAILSGSVTDDGLPSGGTLTSAWTKVSGPGTVTFGSVTNPATTAAFDQPGTYVLRLTGDDSALTASAQVTIVASAMNTPPIVSAGSEQTITLPAAAALGGSVTDDGLPSSGTLTSAWTKVSGAGSVTFGSTTTPATSATFDQPGTYVLRLTADDGELTASADVTVVVNAPTVVPIVTAGPDQTTPISTPVTLAGTATATGLPAGSTLTYRWTKVSGPGTVTFGDAASLTTTATFDQPGTYVLRLTTTHANASASADVTIVVTLTNAPPVVTAGPDQEITLPAQAALNGSVTDDGLPANGGLTKAWSKVSGPGVVTLADAASPATAAAFDQPGTYVLRLTGNDSALTASADVTITVKRANATPVASAGIARAAVVGEPVSFDATSSSDPDGDPLVYEWAFGDGATATGATATHAYASSGLFTARLTVTDPRGASAVAEVTVTIGLPNQAPVANAGGPYRGEVDVQLTFDGSGSSDPEGQALTYAWAFGDGTFGSGSHPSHLYTSAETFTVTVTVTDPAGASRTAVTTAQIDAAPDRAPPTIVLSAPRQAFPGAKVLVSAQVSDNIKVAAVRFDVDGANPIELTAPPYRREIEIPAIAAPGTTLRVNGTATDSSGNSAAATVSITVTAQADSESPSLTLHAPEEIAPGVSMTLSATAADNVGVISVSFLVNGQPVSADLEPPYETTFAVPLDASVGSTLALMAQAEDAAGNRTTTARTVNVVQTADTTDPAV